MNPALPLIILSSVLTALLLPVLYDGVERKIKARLQGRIGPPVHQTLLDLRKLLSKETVEFPCRHLVLYATSTTIVLELAVTVLLNLVLAGLYVEVLIPVAVALIAAIQAASVSASFLTPNPYSQIGGRREAALAAVNETALITGLVLYYYELLNPSRGHWLAVISILALVAIAAYVSSGRTPFDVSEAEVELASGVLVELSGRVLALQLYSIYLKRYIASMLPAAIVLLSLQAPGAVRLLAGYASTLAFWVLYSTTSVFSGRSRVDLTLRLLPKIYLPLILLAVIEMVAT
ncbi:MAG: NADH-quinone oxidoreductase subunit H [Desulfurococcus sp.]|nr:NADH-quinone oxidoreductase subunit H [Desulfurococcus sp.]